MCDYIFNISFPYLHFQYTKFNTIKLNILQECQVESTESICSVVQAIHCRLSDLIPLDGGTWSESCTNRFISLAHQKLVTLVAVGKGVWTCELVLT